MSGEQYTEQFRMEAVLALLERGERTEHEVAALLGVTLELILGWKQEFLDLLEESQDSLESAVSAQNEVLQRQIAATEKQIELLEQADALLDLHQEATGKQLDPKHDSSGSSSDESVASLPRAPRTRSDPEKRD